MVLNSRSNREKIAQGVSSRAQTLLALSRVLESAKVLPMTIFSVNEWTADR